VPFAEIKFTLTPFSLFTDVDLEDDATRFVPAARSIVLVLCKKIFECFHVASFFLNSFYFAVNLLPIGSFFFHFKSGALVCDDGQLASLI